jgi:hypothetical protein
MAYSQIRRKHLNFKLCGLTCGSSVAGLCWASQPQIDTLEERRGFFLESDCKAWEAPDALAASQGSDSTLQDMSGHGARKEWGKPRCK